MTALDRPLIQELAARFVAEDVGRGDRTTEAVVAADANGAARIEARGPALVAGLDVAEACFVAAGGEVEWHAKVRDGDRVDSGAILARVSGRTRTILTGERTALNLLARLSGVATLTRRFVDAAGPTSAHIVDTRKTTPGLRVLEKYAVRVGGGFNHRFGLDDGILIKDNHIAAAGGVTEAVRRARASATHNLKIEVEVADLADLDDALAAGADAVLLDNMTPALVSEAVTRAGGKVLLEASGGVSLDNVAEYAAVGVDLVSVGALTHSAPAVDVALEMES
jgi:nicotinate-nucleotide pyrophosphorylase (carboxylating)